MLHIKHTRGKRALMCKHLNVKSYCSSSSFPQKKKARQGSGPLSREGRLRRECQHCDGDAGHPALMQRDKAPKPVLSSFEILSDEISSFSSFIFYFSFTEFTVAFHFFFHLIPLRNSTKMASIEFRCYAVKFSFSVFCTTWILP